jgi:hypothetical protein
MTAAAQPQLQPGRAYRTRDLRPWSANPTRLARRLVRDGRLFEAAHGLYYAPTPSRFGPLPATDAELLRALLGGAPFLVTGPPAWNALGLGSTAMFACTLVYNPRRTGELVLDGRPFLLRRVAFPAEPSPEWFVVDLLQHHAMAGAALSELRAGLVATLRQGRWDRARLREMARAYGRRETVAVVEEALTQSGERAA